MSRASLERARACRRSRRWTDTIDIYKPVKQMSGKEVISYSYILEYENINSQIAFTPDMGIPDVMGRNKEFNILTSDVGSIRMIDSDGTVLNIFDTYCLVFKTQDHRKYGKCYMIAGDPKIQAKVNLQTFFMREAPAPTGVPNDL